MPAPKYDWKRIEAEVLRNEFSFDYDAIADKYDIPRQLIYNRACQHKWRERHREFLIELKKQRDRDRIAEISQTYSKLDNAALKILEGLLRQVSLHLIDAQKESRKIEPEQIGRLTTSFRQLMDVLKSSKGDTAVALTQLVNNGIMPPDLVPQILGILEQNDINTSEQLTTAFQGRVFLPD